MDPLKCPLFLHKYNLKHQVHRAINTAASKEFGLHQLTVRQQRSHQEQVCNSPGDHRKPRVMPRKLNASLPVDHISVHQPLSPEN